MQPPLTDLVTRQWKRQDRRSVDDVLGIVDALDTDQVDLVGHDLGGA